MLRNVLGVHTHVQGVAMADGCCTRQESFSFHRVKLVVVGNSMVGKTSLISTWSSGLFRDNFNFVMDFHVMDITVDGQDVEIAPWDTPGTILYHNCIHIHYYIMALGEVDIYDRVRLLSYPDTDVFLLCFSLDSWQSYNDVSIRVWRR